MPEFDVEEFYNMAKQINDFIKDPKFNDWSTIIAEATICKFQVFLSANFQNYTNLKIERLNNCTSEVQGLDLRGVIKNDHTDFDKMHQEIDKGFLL